MRIMLVTDAWDPQVNGVVRTMKRVITECEEMGHTWDIVSPNGFKTIPLPTYSEIRLAFGAKKIIEERFLEFEPDAVHIATEGPLGWAARAVCLRHKFPYTTALSHALPGIHHGALLLPARLDGLHVCPRVPQILRPRDGRDAVDARRTGGAAASRTSSPWSRGVDTDLFHPAKRKDDRGPFKGMKQPIWLNVGRVAVEKNIAAFLETDLPGTKVIVGDGPQLEALKEKHKDAHFLGVKQGEELAACFANADCFVFPSLTDTFGLVILEAMAAGTPVAGFNVPGPRDLIPGSNAGAVNDDLRHRLRGSAEVLARGDPRLCRDLFLARLRRAVHQQSRTAARARNGAASGNASPGCATPCASAAASRSRMQTQSTPEPKQTAAKD